MHQASSKSKSRANKRFSMTVHCKKRDLQQHSAGPPSDQYGGTSSDRINQSITAMLCPRLASPRYSCFYANDSSNNHVLQTCPRPLSQHFGARSAIQDANAI